MMQEDLKNSLFGGTLSPADFLQKLFEIDQSAPDHSQALSNLDTLLNAQVIRFFEKENACYEAYLNFLSLTYFHIGQRYALGGDQDVVSFFEKRLAAAQKISDSSSREWKQYVCATVAYFRKNVDEVRMVAAKMEEGPNKNIVKNMIAGLSSRGTIDYERDYDNRH